MFQVQEAYPLHFIHSLTDAAAFMRAFSRVWPVLVSNVTSGP